MNKIKLSILVIAAAMLAFVGCKKDGIYKPKKEISRIFCENIRSGGKQLVETWTWNGDQLKSITYANGDYMSFEYDDKQLKSVTTQRYGYGYSFDFTYEGRKVKECNWYGQSGELQEIYTFEHKGNKISKITCVEISNFEKSTQNDNSHPLFNYLIPNRKLTQNADNQCVTKSKRGGSNEVTLEWDGDNIIKATFEEKEDGDYYSETYEYTYDDKINPFYGSTCHLFANVDATTLCKNNVIEMSEMQSNGNYYEYTYTYTYDGKLPTSRRESMNNKLYEILYFDYK